jgi:indole-3-glycerol phosphate synthase
MPTILDKIAAYKREEVAKAKATIPRSELEGRARRAPKVRGFAKALDAKQAQGEPIQGPDPPRLPSGVPGHGL